MNEASSKGKNRSILLWMSTLLTVALIALVLCWLFWNRSADKALNEVQKTYKELHDLYYANDSLQVPLDSVKEEHLQKLLDEIQMRVYRVERLMNLSKSDLEQMRNSLSGDKTAIEKAQALKTLHKKVIDLEKAKLESSSSGGSLSGDLSFSDNSNEAFNQSMREAMDLETKGMHKEAFKKYASALSLQSQNQKAKAALALSSRMLSEEEREAWCKALFKQMEAACATKSLEELSKLYAQALAVFTEEELVLLKKNVCIDLLSNKPSTHGDVRYLYENLGNVAFKLLPVDAGSFVMGSDKDDFFDNQEHKVELSSFYMMETEVTQALWVSIMGSNPSEFEGCKECPVENVILDDVLLFIRKLNQKTGKTYRLPTEAEWEFAARGGNLSKGFEFAGSNNLLEVAWVNANSKNKTQPVKQKLPNELGLYDMTGNVMERCQDLYDPNYYKTSPSVNPLNSSKGDQPCFRGGSYHAVSDACSVFFRSNNYSHNHFDLGFRLVVSM